MSTLFLHLSAPILILHFLFLELARAFIRSMGAVKAILLGLALVITGLCGWTLMTLPCLPLIFISPPIYRFMNDCSLQLWFKVIPVSYKYEIYSLVV